MLDFDIKKLRSVYVYILKITTDYVYVTTTRSGLQYKPASSTQMDFKGHSVSKIRINRSVSHAYSALFITREFSRPWLASLNYYGDEIVSIEIQLVNRHTDTGYQDASNWQSSFSKVVPMLYEKIKNEKFVYVNGTEIFWPNDEKSDDADIIHESNNGTFSVKNGRLHFSSPHEMALDDKGFFTIRSVFFVSLGSMGQSLLVNKFRIKEEIRVRQEVDAGLASKEDIASLDAKAQLSLQSGKVLSYYPNALHPNEERIHIYSPVLQSASFNSAHSSKKTEKAASEEQKVYFLASTTNRAYANVDFAIKAAQTIGRLYGYDHTDDLNLQDIIQKTGEVSLLNIDENSRKNMPIEMDAMTAIAYLFRFIYKEKDLKNLRELSNMFRYCINRGLVYEKHITGDFLEGVSSVPLSSASSSILAA